MSRVGNAPITVPSGVDISIEGAQITVKGSKGELSRELPGGVTASFEDGTLTVARPDDTKESRAFHGLCRSRTCVSHVGPVRSGGSRRIWPISLLLNRPELRYKGE